MGAPVYSPSTKTPETSSFTTSLLKLTLQPSFHALQAIKHSPNKLITAHFPIHKQAPLDQALDRWQVRFPPRTNGGY